MTLLELPMTISTLFMSEISESLFEILAVAAFYIGSWLLERRKKKNQPQPTPEEVLEEAGIVFDDPVELELPETSPIPPQQLPPDQTNPVSREGAKAPPQSPAESPDWTAVKTGFRRLNARALSIAQDFGRVPSMRTLVRDYERGIRGETRKRLEQFEGAREQWGDLRVRHDAENVLNTLHKISDFMEALGRKRASSDVEWRR